MKRASFALSAVLTLALGTVAVAQESKPLPLGEKAPMATTKMKSAADGKEVSISQVAGPKGTLVVFTCNHCPFAKAWEQRIVELANGYSKKGVGAILINSNDPGVNKGDSPEAMAERAKERGMQIPYAVDATSGIAKAFGATKTPEAFLFDKSGKLVYHGTIDDNHEQPEKVQKRYLKDALEAVVSGKAPATAETKSLGCSIKFRKV